MGRWVLLKHELPDGSWHHDLMIDTDPALSATLLSFRLSSEVAWPPIMSFVGTRIANHRRDYLSYEGPVSGNRGTVRRVAEGGCTVRTAGEGLDIDIAGRGFHAAPAAPAQGGPGELWRFWEIRANLED